MPNQYSVPRRIVIPVGPSIAYVPLTREQWSLIDSEYVTRVGAFRWTASLTRKPSTFYARRQIVVGGQRKSLGLHNFLFGETAQTIDHRNGNRLDNRKSNLREASPSQQQHNQEKQRNNTSGFKGVTWDKRKNKWMAKIFANGRGHFLGYFLEAHDAGKSYDEAAKIHHGEFAHFYRTSMRNTSEHETNP